MEKYKSALVRHNAHTASLLKRGRATGGTNGLCAKPERIALQFFISKDEQYEDSLSRGIIGQANSEATREMYTVPGNAVLGRRHQRKVQKIKMNKLLVSNLRQQTLQEFVNVFDLQAG